MPDRVPPRLRLSISGEDATDLPKRLDRFAEISRIRRGMRVVRRDTGFEVSIDLARVEMVGPVVEAGAATTGLRVIVDDLDAEIRSSGLDGRASGVWAAIGNAVDEDAVIASRGTSPSGDIFRHLRVETIDGVRVVVDARSPLVEPVGAPPMDAGPQKFDDVGWHEGVTAESDHQRRLAFTHIGIYLAWLIRHDLHDPRWFPRDHVQAIKDGSMTGSDIADDIDGKLISDEMTADGAEFSAARYSRYVTEYGLLVGGNVMYHVLETDSLYEKVAPLIDGLYAEWVAAGRPAPEPEGPSPLEAEFDALFLAADVPWEEIGKDADGPVGVQLNADGSYEVIRPEAPHDAPDLEALIPTDLVEPPIQKHSTTATHWGSSLLNRALKQLGVRPRDVMVAVGLGGSGTATFSVTVYRIPGASQAALREAFSSVIWLPRGSSWSDRLIGDATVSWADGTVDGMTWNIAYWTRDELVFQVAGHPDDITAAVRRIG